MLHPTFRSIRTAREAVGLFGSCPGRTRILQCCCVQKGAEREIHRLRSLRAFALQDECCHWPIPGCWWGNFPAEDTGMSRGWQHHREQKDNQAPVPGAKLEVGKQAAKAAESPSS
jgi:hypothetical protein